MKIFLILFLSSIVQGLIAQNSVTTFILLRHAEKMADGSKDPDLSESGKARAVQLVSLLNKAKIDAIYSTNFKRTQNTVLPLAQAQHLTILNYEGGKTEALDDILAKFHGGTVVICGHSNTTPALINYLTGNKDEFKAFEDSDYGNFVIVSVVKRGEAKVTWLRY
jgi:2,3-bisphosphoglycerate-dependent phosphoglycerate mutase